MFDVGFWELVLVGLVALLAFGPDELPRLVRDTVRLVRKLRAAAHAAGSELRRELQLDELDLPQPPRTGSLLNQVRDVVEEVRTPLLREFDKVEPGIPAEHPPYPHPQEDAAADGAVPANGAKHPSAGTGQHDG